MSKPSKLKSNRRLSGEVNILIDSGFTPDAIIRYLKRAYDMDVSRATVYRYKKDHYRPKPQRRAVLDKLFKDCGRFVDVLEGKVGIAVIFMDRIDKALKREEQIGLSMKITGEMLMDLNTVLNELYEMYQDMGLLPIRDERISIDATLTEKSESKSRLEIVLGTLSSEDKEKFTTEIKDKIRKLSGGEDDGGGSWIQHTDDRN